MRRILEIIGSSLSLTWQEFRSHKVRTLLSLSGVAFGIFCIIGVLAAVDSLEYAVQKDIKALGTNTSLQQGPSCVATFAVTDFEHPFTSVHINVYTPEDKPENIPLVFSNVLGMI